MSASNENQLLRLQKVIADCGVCSRRKAEHLMIQGKVVVNGKTITELGTKVDPMVDVIQVDGQTIELFSVEKLYIVMNKPRGYVTTVSDPEGRETVMDLLFGVKQRVYPVGRLDFFSEGLLILTNDGEFANMIMHPKFEVEKTYEVKVFGHVNEGILNRIRNGVMSEEGLLKPQSVRVIEQLPNKTWLEFRLREGKNREIRRICEALDLTVDKLRRVAIGGLNIQTLPMGQYVFAEKKDLLRAIGMNTDGTKTNIEAKFVSRKKTLNPKKVARIVSPQAKLATDPKFHSFRRENYYETVQSMKLLKEEREALLKSV